MPIYLACAAAAAAIAAIVADWNERRPLAFKLLKPATTLLIAALLLYAPAGDYRLWMLGALGFSLAGDIALMYDGERPFLAGLGSFLVAHGLFVAALALGVTQWTMPWYAWVVPVYAIAVGAVLVPRAGAMKAPLAVYGAALAALLIVAMIRQQQFGDTASALALAGSVLFALSDTALGIRLFVGRYAGAQGVILSTYWAAIGLLAWSALAQ